MHHKKFKLKWLSVISIGIFTLSILLQGLLISPTPTLAWSGNGGLNFNSQDSTTSNSNTNNFSTNWGRQAQTTNGAAMAKPNYGSSQNWGWSNHNDWNHSWTKPATPVTPPIVTPPVTTPTTTPPIVTPPVTTPTTTPPIVIPPVVTPTTTPPIVTPPVTVPSSTLKWGVFLGSGTSDNLTAFEQSVGNTADMQATFVGWGDNFPTALATQLKASGKTLVIFWEQYGVTLDSINAGDSDAYIKTFAADAQASGASVMLAPFHEMNGNWDPWDGTVGNNTPTKLINAWRHVHDLFSSATNVKFAWDVNNVSVPNTAANAINVYYPGDAYVDYVAVDGFNFDSKTWSQVFPASLMNSLASYNKPVYILSTASVPSAQKAQWILDMGAQIKNYPSVVGWVWFNQNGADGNWLVNSDSASLAAFKSIIN